MIVLNICNAIRKNELKLSVNKKNCLKRKKSKYKLLHYYILTYYFYIFQFNNHMRSHDITMVSCFLFIFTFYVKQ